jgi:hypothetical protein
MDQQTIIIAILVAILCALIFCAFMKKGGGLVENYRDPIWMNKKKMYDDWYPRAGGSIYGTYYQPWDMFSGFPVFPRAY